MFSETDPNYWRAVDSKFLLTRCLDCYDDDDDDDEKVGSMRRRRKVALLQSRSSLHQAIKLELIILAAISRTPLQRKECHDEYGHLVFTGTHFRSAHTLVSLPPNPFFFQCCQKLQCACRAPAGSSYVSKISLVSKVGNGISLGHSYTPLQCHRILSSFQNLLCTLLEPQTTSSVPLIRPR